MLFADRADAGRKLATFLHKYIDPNTIILVLPRGGVPVGFEISKAFHISMNVINARKLGSPNNVEFGVGAVSEGNVRVLDSKSIEKLNLSKEKIDEITKRENIELERRIKLYRNGQHLPSLKGKTVLLVDDGLATGVSAYAAIKSIKKLKPKKIFFASPVCAQDTAKEFELFVDKVFCLMLPESFNSVGQWYRSFNQISDEEVINLLEECKTI